MLRSMNRPVALVTSRHAGSSRVAVSEENEGTVGDPRVQTTLSLSKRHRTSGLSSITYPLSMLFVTVSRGSAQA